MTQDQTYDQHDKHTPKPDAVLIEAAPDLLEACKVASAFYARSDLSMAEYIREGAAAKRKLDDAIAKATGTT